MENQNNMVSTNDAVNAWLKYVEKFSNSKVGVTELYTRGYSAKEIQHMFITAIKNNIPIDIKNL